MKSVPGVRHYGQGDPVVGSMCDQDIRKVLTSLSVCPYMGNVAVQVLSGQWALLSRSGLPAGQLSVAGSALMSSARP